MDNAVPLVRRFQPVPKDVKADWEETSDWRFMLGLKKHQAWADLHLAYRTVVLADAGAGKTFEMQTQAEQLRRDGRSAFFFRIEELVSQDIYDALEIGTSTELEQWINGTDEGWLFLDSVDEARLDGPQNFEKAIQRLSKGIAKALQRAHVYVSSRPYAWRPTLDRELIKRHLPFRDTAEPAGNPDNDKQKIQWSGSVADRPAEVDSDPTVLWLCPLSRDDIRSFAVERETPRIDEMLSAIDRANLWSIAERPFDLDELISSWKAKEPFGSRTEILKRGVAKRLEEIHPDREGRQPLPVSLAQKGARLLAAAVVLSGQPGIRVPEARYNKTGLNSEELLGGELQPIEITALLGRGIFNDAIYGAVRMRHREVRDLLAAEWIQELLGAGASRHKIESLFFAEQYGEQVVRPRLRSLLPWLILSDESIRARALAISPEIAVEGGDADCLPLAIRREILVSVVERIVNDQDTRSGRDNDAIARIAHGDLAEDASKLIAQYAENDDAIFFLGRLVWQGRMASCLPSLERLACNPALGIYARIASVRAVLTVGGPDQGHRLWRQLIQLSGPFERRLLAELLNSAHVNADSVSSLLLTLGLLEPYKQFESTGLTQSVHNFIDRIDVLASVKSEELLVQLASNLIDLLRQQPHIEQEYHQVSNQNYWLMSVAIHVIERLVEHRSYYCLDPMVIDVLVKIPEVASSIQSAIFDDFTNK